MNRSRIDTFIPLVALALAATGTIARNGTTIDLAATANSPTDSLTFLGFAKNGTAQFSLEESTNDSTWTAVAAAEVVTCAAAGLATDGGAPVCLGYLGNKRYVRLIHAAPSATAITSGIAMIGDLNRSVAVTGL
jgi:hypothetical protein